MEVCKTKQKNYLIKKHTDTKRSVIFRMSSYRARSVALGLGARVRCAWAGIDCARKSCGAAATLFAYSSAAAVNAFTSVGERGVGDSLADLIWTTNWI